MLTNLKTKEKKVCHTLSDTVKCTYNSYVTNFNLTEFFCSCWEVLLQLSAAQQRCDATRWKVCVKSVSKCPHLSWLHGWWETLNPRFLENTVWRSTEISQYSGEHIFLLILHIPDALYTVSYTRISPGPQVNPKCFPALAGRFWI